MLTLMKEKDFLSEINLRLNKLQKILLIIFTKNRHKHKILRKKSENKIKTV